jgi:multisubunit Na+/H+ antiporter MnhF subunit
MTREDEISQEMSAHIFTVSAGLVGVCLTVLSLFRVIFRLSKAHELADALIAIDALGFLIACVFAYLSLRARGRADTTRFHLVADVAFLMSLSFMVAVCGLIAYEFI